MTNTSQKPIRFYMDKYYMFDNFSAFAIVWRDQVWPTAEHAYQAAKFTDWEIIDQIREVKSAHDAKKIAEANNSKKRKDWEEIKVSVMENVLRLKRDQHEYVQRKLLETGTRELIEDSPTDDFWGRGPNGDGQNHVGKIWMKLREELVEKLNRDLVGYLNTVNDVLKRTHSGATITVSPVNPESEAYKLGLRHIIVLPWPDFEGDNLKVIIKFVRSSIDIFAEPKCLESFGQGPVGAAGGTMVLYLGLRAKTKQEGD